MTALARSPAALGVERGRQLASSSAHRPWGWLSSRVKYSTGFFRATAVSISDRQLGERRAVSDRKNRTMAERRMWVSMFLGQSLPAGMPSSYHSRTFFRWSRVMVSSTSWELRWE